MSASRREVDSRVLTGAHKASASKEPVLVGAVELARAAAVEVAEEPSDVGEHVDVLAEGERLVAHRFVANMKGYRGWYWVVTLARVPRGRVATICEVDLLPGTDALLAPAWLPWADRLRPGDIGAGDVLPFRPDDPRLEPGWRPELVEHLDLADLDATPIEELALARIRVLSPYGREEAAQRWYRGSQGPTAPGAVAATAACITCGFFVRLSGRLGQLFGACTNEWSPDDAQVVSFNHGCGAHSETDAETVRSEWPDQDPMIDEHEIVPFRWSDRALPVAPPGQPGEAEE